MNTGNTSKTALAAARLALLTGVSALAFAGTAAAQTTYIEGNFVHGAFNTGITQLVGSQYAQMTNGAFFTADAGLRTSTLAGDTLALVDPIAGTNANLSASGLSFGGTGGTTSLNQLGLITSSVVAGQVLAGTGGVVSLGQVQVGPSATGVTLNTDGTSTFNNTATFNGTGANAGTNTTVNGALATLTGTSGQSITLNAVADPVLTVTNGTVAGTTTINNGVVTAGTSVNAPTGNFTTVNATTVHATTVDATTANVTTANVTNANISNSLAVANGANVNLGDNVVHGVATPIVGTDAANKAYVDTTLNKGLNKAYEGTAMALAISQPILMNGQSFAVRAGWGDYESQSAGGVSVAGVVARDLFGYGSTVVLDGGVGFGNSGDVAGKAGVTFGFGGGAAPLK